MPRKLTLVLFRKLMLSCPVEIHEIYSSHVTVIEELYSKIVMRHKIATQSVCDQVRMQLYYIFLLEAFAQNGTKLLSINMDCGANTPIFR